jgi:hypothetical protein
LTTRNHTLIETYDLLTPRYKTRIPVGLYAEKWKVESIKGRPLYSRLTDKRALDYLAQVARERVKAKKDCIFMITGERRTGKSTLAIEIAKRIDPTFKVENICYRLSDWYKALAGAPKADPIAGVYPQIILDEAGIDFYAKQWNREWQHDGVQVLEIVGIKNLVLYFLVPHEGKLTTDIRGEMCHIWINTDPDPRLEIERGYAVARHGKRDIYKQKIWWLPNLAFFFPEVDGGFWEKYSVKKDTFTEAIIREKAAKMEARDLK